MFAAVAASTHPVARVVFYPNGSTFAALQPNYGVTLLDRAGGQIIGTIPIPRVAEHTAAVFCAGGSRLAVGSLRGVHLFDVATCSLVGRCAGPLVVRTSLAERGGMLIAATPAGLWEIRVSADPTSRSLLPHTLPLQSRATLVALSPDGRWGFGVYARVRPSLIDLRTGRVPVAVDHRYRGGANTPAVEFAPDSSRFAVCDGNDVAVYDTPAEPDVEDDEEADPSLVQRADRPVAPKPRSVLKPMFVLERPPGVPPKEPWRPPVAFTPDGRALLVRRPRNRVQLWDVATGAKTAEWSWRMDGVRCLAVSPDGLTAVAGARFGVAVVWDLE